MFKSRLIHLGKNIVSAMIALLILVAWGYGIYLLDKYTMILETIDSFMEVGLPWILCAIVGFVVLVGLVKFIYWIAIEPYKHHKKSRSE